MQRVESLSTLGGESSSWTVGDTMKIANGVNGNGTSGLGGDEGMKTRCAQLYTNLGVLLRASHLGIFGCGF
jgi:hypothetical protein